MKKFLISVFSCVFSLLISCLVLFNVNSNFSQAETSNQKNKYELISPNCNNDPDKTLAEYNIKTDLVSTFTPFNYETGTRYDGTMSFGLPKTDSNKIENQFVYPKTVNIPKGEYSFFAWIHFDNIYVHDLTISLELVNNAKISWSINKSDLINLIKKTTNLTFNEFPYSWNKIEFPFALATITGDIYNGDYLYGINRIIINYASNGVNNEESGDDILKPDFASLRFYDLYISESESKTSYSVEKQSYRFYKFNFFEEDIINAVCVGDSLRLPLLDQAVSYAWNGYDDLKYGNISTVSWRVLLKTPSSDTEFLYPSFGSKIDFNEQGTYQLYYQCFDTKYSNTQPIVSDSIVINVNKLNAIYFDKSSYSIEVNKTYRTNIHTSSLFSSVSDFVFKCDSKNIEFNYLGNGVLEFTAKEKGDYEINVSVEGIRPISSEEKSYSKALVIKAFEEKSNNNKVFKIILWCVLGVFGISLLIIGIKTLVKVRKVDVK